MAARCGRRRRTDTRRRMRQGPAVEAGPFLLRPDRTGTAPIPFLVMPAKAGIQGKRRSLTPWIPAFAGMTIEESYGYSAAFFAVLRRGFSMPVASQR